MKAYVLTAFGGAENFDLRDVPAPNAGPGQVRVRVRVRAVGINPLEVKVRNGWLRDAFPTTFPAILGNEVAGTIDQLGDGVDGVAVGDRVLGFVDGGAYAEYAVARPAALAGLPDGVSFESAAALPVAAEASQRALALLDVRDGETVVVNGAAGAVGSAAVQLLVRRAVTVVGTASAANHDYLRGLGAIPVAYGEGVVERIRAAVPSGVDAVLDVAGKGFARDAIALRGGPDRIVTLADMEAPALGIAFAAGNPFALTAETLPPVVDLAAGGGFAVAIDRVFPFDAIPAAHALSEGGHLRGKIVVAVA